MSARKTPAPTARATSSDVKAALRLRYPADAFGFFEEVGNATGAGVARHADGRCRRTVAVPRAFDRGHRDQGVPVRAVKP